MTIPPNDVTGILFKLYIFYKHLLFPTDYEDENTIIKKNSSILLTRAPCEKNPSRKQNTT